MIKKACCIFVVLLLAVYTIGSWAEVPVSTGLLTDAGKIQGAKVPKLTAADDDKVPAFVYSTGAIEWRPRGGGGTEAITAHEGTYNHPNIPTTAEKGAMTGTTGTPGAGNAFVTDSDPRMTDARTPSAHNQATSTITGLDAALAAKADTAGLGTAAYTAVTDYPRAADTAATPTDTDTMPVQREGGWFKSAWSSIKTTLKSYFDGIYATKAQGDAVDTKGPRSHTITVCAANAFKTTDCDYQCDGVDDQVQFQQAIDSLDASGDYWYGGTIMASVGNFYFSDTATITSSYINIKGQGRGSLFIPRTNNFLFNVEKENKIFDGVFIDGGSRGRYRTNGVVFGDIGFGPEVDYIAAASGDGVTVTIDTTLPHNLLSGQQVWIRSSHDHWNTDLYGVFTATVVSPTRITIPSSASNFTELPLMSIAGRFIKAVDASQIQMDKIYAEGAVQAFKGINIFDGWIINSNLMHSGAGSTEDTATVVLSSADTRKTAGFKILGGRIESWGQGAGTQLLTTGVNTNDDLHVVGTKMEGYRWWGDPMQLSSYTAAGPTIKLDKINHFTLANNNSNGGCNTWLTVGSTSSRGVIVNNWLALFRNAEYTAATTIFSEPIILNGGNNLVANNHFLDRSSLAPAAITLTSGSSNNRVTGNHSDSTAVPLIANNSGNTTNKIYKNAGDDVTAVVDGGTGLSSAADDALMVGNGAAWQSKTLPDCDAVGKKLNYDTGTNTFICVDEDGASSASSITGGDSSVAVTDAGDGHVAVTEDGTEVIRVTGGSVGVGTTSPDTKLEVVGDISTTEFTYGSELVTNGTFDSDLSGWTGTTGWAFDSGHALHVTGSTGLSQSTLSPTSGKWYSVSISVGGTFGGGYVQVNFGGIGKIIKSVGNYSYIMSPSATNTLILSNTTDFTGYVDNISIKEISNGAVYAARAIGIGTTTPTKSLQIESQGQSSVLLRGSTGYGSTVELQHNEVPSSSSSLLGGVFLGAQHTTDAFANSLEISGVAGGAWTTGSSYPSAWVFKTTASGSTSRTERMRIAPDGAVCIGNTTCTGAGNLQAKQFQDTPYAPAAGTTFTVDLANGMDQELTTSGNVTITLPTPAAGKSYSVRIKYGGAHTVTWAGGGTLRWSNGVAPVATSVSGKYDEYVFDSDATSTYTFGKDGGRNY